MWVGHTDNNVLHYTSVVLTHLAQVNLYDLVIFTAIIRDQVLFELISHGGNL